MGQLARADRTAVMFEKSTKPTSTLSLASALSSHSISHHPSLFRAVSRPRQALCLSVLTTDPTTVSSSAHP